MKKYFLYINNLAFDKKEVKKLYISIDTNLISNTSEFKNCIYIKINESTLSYNKLKVDYLKQANIKIYDFIKILDKLNIFTLILPEVTKIFEINEEKDTTIQNNEIEEIINKTIFKYASLINNELE